MKKCGSCRFFTLHEEIVDPVGPMDGIGECSWRSLTLPWSLRYANRVRTPVYIEDGKNCPTYEMKQTSQTP